MSNTGNGAKPLRYWRVMAGLSQGQLAARVGVGPATISRLELGQRAGSPELWRRIEEALGVEREKILEFQLFLEKELSWLKRERQ